MAVPGFKGSRAIESEEAEYKGLVRGLLLGCALPSVMLCLFLYQTGVNTNLVSKDAGAPIEVMERTKTIARPVSRKVFFKGANRTVQYDAANPYNRGGGVKASLSQKRLRDFLNKTKQKSAPMPWDIREARNEKRMAKKAPPPKNKKGPVPHVPDHVQAALSAARGKRVFDGSSQGRGFAPGAVRVPTAGTKLQTMARFQKLVDQKCATLVGFYNSKDAEMSREFSLVWDMVVRSSALKYTGAFVDVATAHGGEIAANASVIKVEGASIKPIGTPAVVAYLVQRSYDEPYAKVVLRDMQEAGVATGRAGKDTKTLVGKDALVALRIRHEAIASLTKKLTTEIERRGLQLDAKGCYLKDKSEQAYDAAEKARAKDKATKKEAKAEKKEAKAAPKDAKTKDAKAPKGKVTSEKDAKKKVLAGGVEP